MPKWFITAISALIIFIAFGIGGCSSPTISEINPLAKAEDLEDPNFLFIYRIAWLDQNRLIAMMAQNRSKGIGEDIGRIIVWDKNTDEYQLIYEGNEMTGFMPDGLVFGEDDIIYAYDSISCVLINKKTLSVERIIPVHTPSASCPSIYGDLVMRTNDDLGIIKHDAPSQLITLLEGQKVVTEEGIEYSIFYESPRWSPDGKWIVFYKLTEEFYAPPLVSIIDIEGNNEKNFVFDTATSYAWSRDSQNLIILNDGSIFGGPLEMRVINIETGDEIIEFFDQPIEGHKIYFLEILDVFDTKIVMRAFFDYNDKRVRPALLYDWATKEKKWITEISARAVSAAFSPDGKTIAVTGGGSMEVNRIVLFDIE